MKILTQLELTYLGRLHGPLASSWRSIAASRALLEATKDLVTRRYRSPSAPENAHEAVEEPAGPGEVPTWLPTAEE